MPSLASMDLESQTSSMRFVSSLVSQTCHPCVLFVIAIFLLLISSFCHQMRAQNQQDLIYKRGQAGITKASVTIVFDNSDRENSPLGMENYAQITVTRQVRPSVFYLPPFFLPFSSAFSEHIIVPFCCDYHHPCPVLTSTSTRSLFPISPNTF